MEKFKGILLDVWREACRNIEITNSLPMISAILVHHLPLKQILLCRIDPVHSSLVTLATGLDEPSPRYCPSRAYSRIQINRMKSWHRRKEIIHRGSNPSKSVLPLLLPYDEANDILAGPLENQGHSLPVLIFEAREGQVFSSRHVEMMRTLLEPFTIALENDSRLKEIVHLREAAEADKKTLLTKLSRREMGDIVIGADNGLKGVMERVELIADSDVPVLIFGETGTGKELIARAIHQRSGRSEGPFIRVNCGAIPTELIDSQLFGHEKGAFTGAVERRKGWFERADGGTLFLDEVGEMPLNAQVRLLRILQDGWLELVGGKHPLKVDVRIVLATHRDLAMMVSEGTFRDDLWYRISTFPVFLPPLRDRLEDLRMLAEHFARRSAIRFGLPVVMPVEDDIRLLSSYPWPGNIRELGTVIDRAALLGNGDRLEIAKALGWTDSMGNQRQTTQKRSGGYEYERTVCSLDACIKKHIEQALIQTKGKIEGKGGAAEWLEINPHTLRARMRKLGIRWSAYRE